MLDNPAKWLVYLLIVAAIVFIGWKQPLRYRFMSKAEIDLLENPAQVTPRSSTPIAHAPPASPTPNWMWDPNRRTPLDRDSYNQSMGTRRTYYATPNPTR